MRFWISWWQPGPDSRPWTDPPNPDVLGWWISGERGDGASSVCALVSAQSEVLARAAVLRDWPEADEWRFCNAVENTWRPGDRFPLGGMGEGAHTGPRGGAMSGREWRPTGAHDSEQTGDDDNGALVHFSPFSATWTAEAWHRRGQALREMGENGLEDANAAKALASRWLDEREAEAQRAPAALEGTPATGKEEAP